MGTGARGGPGALGEAPSAQASPPNPRLREKVRGRPGKEPRRAWVGVCFTGRGERDQLLQARGRAAPRLLRKALPGFRPLKGQLLGTGMQEENRDEGRQGRPWVPLSTQTSPNLALQRRWVGALKLRERTFDHAS